VTDAEAPILFAFDGSEHARIAIQHAARELRPGRHAVVLTVWQSWGAAMVGGAALSLPEDLAVYVEDETSKVAAEGARLARQVGFKATPVANRGDPVWQRIVDVADEVSASVIVLGSHGRTGISHVLLGSVAEAAARHTDRNVLIVHRPAGTS
jgi:nucleotide-binding universal stress UspA family protein